MSTPADLQPNPEVTLFSWWVRGGEPGPGWTSDALEVRHAGGRVVALYTRSRTVFDNRMVSRADEFEMEVRPEMLGELARMLLATGLFARTLAEEDDRGMRDILKETWELQRGVDRLAKTLYEPFPAELEDLRVTCRNLCREMVRLVPARPAR